MLPHGLLLTANRFDDAPVSTQLLALDSCMHSLQVYPELVHAHRAMHGHPRDSKRGLSKNDGIIIRGSPGLNSLSGTKLFNMEIVKCVADRKFCLALQQPRL